MHKVTVNGKTEYAPHGTLLSDIINKSYKGVDHLCGGKGICKKCTVTVDGKPQLSCRYKVESDIIVCFDKMGDILSETGAHQSGTVTDNVCYALDIGTTTLALALVSLDEKQIIKVITRTNPQINSGFIRLNAFDDSLGVRFRCSILGEAYLAILLEMRRPCPTASNTASSAYPQWT